MGNLSLLHAASLPPAWAEKRGYKTAKAARNDVYRAANSLLRLALDGRLSLCFHPPGYSEQKGQAGPAVLWPKGFCDVAE